MPATSARSGSVLFLEAAEKMKTRYHPVAIQEIDILLGAIDDAIAWWKQDRLGYNLEQVPEMARLENALLSWKAKHGLTMKDRHETHTDHQ
jgi:hypothetical protein